MVSEKGIGAVAQIGNIFRGAQTSNAYFFE